MSSKEFDRLIRPVKLCSLIMGVWPSNKKSNFVIEWIKSYQLHFMFLVAIFHVTTTTWDAFRNRHDINELTDPALVASTGYLSFFRFVAFLTHRKDLAFVIDVMRSDWSLPDKDKQILREKTYKVYKAAKIFIIILITSVFSYLPGALLEVKY